MDRRTPVPGIAARLARRAAVVASMSLLATLPASAQFAIEHGVIAGGGATSASAGGCLSLDGTLGQALAGTMSGGTYAITSGYWTHIDMRSRDALFHSGFEACQ